MTDTRTDPVDTAHRAAELIRQLNHETLNADRISAPELRRIVSHLAVMVDRLPQTFEQLAAHLNRQHEAGRIVMDDGSDPTRSVIAAQLRLNQAAALAEPANRLRYGTPAGPFGEAVHEAYGHLLRMGGVLDD